MGVHSPIKDSLRNHGVRFEQKSARFPAEAGVRNPLESPLRNHGVCNLGKPRDVRAGHLVVAKPVCLCRLRRAEVRRAEGEMDEGGRLQGQGRSRRLQDQEVQGE